MAERIMHILQKEVEPDYQASLGLKPQKIPKTVVVPEIQMKLRVFMPFQIIDESPPENIVPEADVVRYSLRSGDKVTQIMTGGKWVISTINDIPINKRPKHRPNIDEVVLDHPNRCHGIESVVLPDRRDNRIIQTFGWAGARYGLGQRAGDVGTSDSGKTWTGRAIMKALMLLTLKNPNLYVIILHVGERPEDGTVIENEVLSLDHDQTHVEFYQAPSTLKPFVQYHIAAFAAERIQQLASDGRDCVFVVDSGSRIFMAHSLAPEILKANSGMISKGLQNSTIPEVITKIVAKAGRITSGYGGSISILFSMLKDGNNTESVPWEEIKSQLTCIYAHGPWSKKPSIDLAETRGREAHRYFTPAQLFLDDLIKKLETVPQSGERNSPDPNITRSERHYDLITMLLDSGDYSERSMFLQLCRKAIQWESAPSSSDKRGAPQDRTQDPGTTVNILRYLFDFCKEWELDPMKILYELTGLEGAQLPSLLNWFVPYAINITPILIYQAEKKTGYKFTLEPLKLESEIAIQFARAATSLGVDEGTAITTAMSLMAKHNINLHPQWVKYLSEQEQRLLKAEKAQREGVPA